jgi:hypothetical protein
LGAADRRGALNYLTPDRVLAAAGEIRLGRTVSLAASIETEVTPDDTAPSLAAGVELPVHVLAINALGLHLLDYLQFEDLVPLCEATGRWSFFCVVAPLRLPHGTGSPVNPIAVM